MTVQVPGEVALGRWQGKASRCPWREPCEPPASQATTCAWTPTPPYMREREASTQESTYCVHRPSHVTTPPGPLLFHCLAAPGPQTVTPHPSLSAIFKMGPL